MPAIHFPGRHLAAAESPSCCGGATTPCVVEDITIQVRRLVLHLVCNDGLTMPPPRHPPFETAFKLAHYRPSSIACSIPRCDARSARCGRQNCSLRLFSDRDAFASRRYALSCPVVVFSFVHPFARSRTPYSVPVGRRRLLA